METQLNLFAAVQAVRVASIWAMNCGLYHLCDYDPRRGVYTARCDREIAHRPGEWYAASETQPAQCCARCRELAKDGRG